MRGNLCSYGKKKKTFSSQYDSRMLWMKIKLHIMLLLWTCGAFPIVEHCPFSKKRHIHDYGMANRNKLGGGHEMLVRTIKYCERWPDFLSVPLTKPKWRASHPPLPHASSLNNFSALSRWHLVAYFLSYPFISCHFSEASQVAAAKRNGRWLE